MSAAASGSACRLSPLHPTSMVLLLGEEAIPSEFREDQNLPCRG